MSQENVEIVRAALEAFDRRDFDAVMADVAPDAVLDWSRAIGPYRGVHRVDDFLGFLLGDFSEAFESTRLELIDLIDAGEHVVVPWSFHLEGRDRIAVAATGTLLWTIREGKAVRISLFQEKREALDAAGLSE